jgi:WD40 repeat protein
VLVVDQFEEVFTMCTDERERIAFIDAITAAAVLPEGELTIVLAMRADYYGRCAEHDALASLVAASQILVGSMKADELRRAIELPAQRAGLSVEDRLTDALVEHTVNRPGGLPLLSTALLELWTRRQDRALRFHDYLRTGGVEGAVARMAEGAFGRLDIDEQAAAKRILLRLAGTGEGSEVVARTAPLRELELDRDADASRVLEALTATRLVTVAEGSVEVAHESLLRDWPRLRGWLEDDAEGRRLHRHVTDSARAWDEGGRDDGDLYRGARLTAALDWADAHDPDLNTAEREYLAASRTESEGEVTRVRRTNRRIRGLLAGVAMLLVLSLIVGSLALGQRDSARAATDVADARLLAARSLTEKDLTVSLLLAREAVDLDDTAETRSALLAALQRDPAAIASMHADGATPGDLTEWLQLSPDGHTIASGGARTTVDFFDAVTNQPLWTVPVGAETTTGAFSPDGGTLAVAAAHKGILAIDLSTRTSRSVKTGRRVDALLFAPQGGSLLSAESNGQEGFLVARDPVTLEPNRPPVRSASGPMMAMALSSDGRRLVTTGLLPPDSPGPLAYTTLWDERELRPLGKPFPWGGNAVALSPDGRTAAIAAARFDSTFGDGLKGRLVLLDLRTGDARMSRESRRHSVGPPLGLTGVAFTADGRSVISTGDDHRILIWDPSSGPPKIEEPFDDPEGQDAFTPVVSPDGATVFTIDADGDIVEWDLTGGRSLGRRFTAGSGAPWNFGLPWFAISPDGGKLAIVQNVGPSRSGSVRLVDTSTMQTLHVLPLPFGAVTPGLAFSPDNQTLALTSFGGYVQLWDVRTGRSEGPPFAIPVSRPDEVSFWTTAFSPDGSMLATAGSDGPCGTNEPCSGVVFLWDVATGQLIRRLPKLGSTVFAVNFSPDGGLLVVSAGVHDGGDEIVWNMSESRVERTIPADDEGVFWADISNDGTTLVTGGQSSGETFWNLSTGDRIGSPISSLPVNTVDLSPDGRTLVAAGQGWVTLRDVGTESILGRSWSPGVEADDQLAALFTRDGDRLYIVSATGDGWVWNVDPASWEARACQIAGRPFTEAEWQVNLPDRPYDPTCTS